MKKLKTSFVLTLFGLILSFQTTFAQYSHVYQDFEDNTFPPTGWTTNFWQHDFNASGYGIGSKSTVMTLYYYCFGSFPLEAPVFSPSVAGDSLIFDYAYAPLDYFTFNNLDIYYSDNNGIDYYLLYTMSGDPNFPGELITSPPNPNYFYPNQFEWATFRFELPVGTTNIKFEPSYGNCSNNLYLDNVRIGQAVPYTDVAVKQVYSKGRYARTFLSNDTISAYIKNEGNLPVSNLKVYLKITGANIFSDSVTVVSLPTAANQVVKFKPFTPSVNGNGIVKVSITHNDQNSDNDSALYNLNVNSNILSYTDTAGISSIHGFYNRIYFFHKYYLTNANSRVGEIRIKIPNYPFYLTDQVITGVLLNSAGTVITKSEPYKLQVPDTGKYISLKLSNPLPYYPAVTNTYFYAGIEISDPIRDDYFFPFTTQTENPTRQNAYFYAFDRSKAVGENLPNIYDMSTFNPGYKYKFDVHIENMPSIDAGISNLGNTYDQYYNSTTVSQKGKVYNNALSGTANATVIRTITPGGYTNSQSVSIPANSSIDVTFTNWAFISGTTYTIRDSIILSGDVNLTNNVMKGTITPRIAKDLVIFYQKQEDKDSLERAINTDGRYANNYDVIDLNYSGSFRPWKIIFANPKSNTIFQNNIRDSLKAFLDNSTAGNKKTLAVFANTLSLLYDLASNSNATIGDTIFMRQYLKAKFVLYDWINTLFNNESRFKGKGFFSGITQDSLSLQPENPLGIESPDLIQPINGSSVAFLPQYIEGSGNDSANAVSYAGVNYNTFFMSNRFSALRATNASPLDGPVTVYTKIIDWIQSVNTGVKVLDLTVLLEGFYNPDLNSMNRDTVRVYLRNATNPFAIIDSSKDLLSPAGQASFLFNNAVNGVNYYLHIKHRNALETWSKTPVSFSSNQLTYDFTDNSNKAFGDNMKLSGIKWVIFGGDVKQDGFVELDDNTLIDNDAFNFVSGYVITDVTGDDFVDLGDQTIADNNAFNFVTKITPLSSPRILAKKGIILDNYLEQNTQFNSQQIPMREYKTDNEIYERFKNVGIKIERMPEIKFIEKGNGKYLIKILK